MQVIIHNGTTYRVDSEKMARASERAAECFRGSGAITITDNCPEESFSLFLDLCQSTDRQLLKSDACAALLSLFEEWKCPSVLTELEDMILRANDHSISIAFLKVDPQAFPRVLSLIAGDYSSLLPAYPQLADMKLLLIQGLQSAAPQCTASEVLSRFRSYSASARAIDEQIALNKRKISDIQAQTAKAEEDTAALQVEIATLEREIERKQSENSLLANSSLSKIASVNYLLQQISVETSQIKSLQSETEHEQSRLDNSEP